ncbi:transporter substrate-binding domain-containing protein [Cupriavidus basilensis]
MRSRSSALPIRLTAFRRWLRRRSDIVAANFTITDERRQQIGFSTPYFAGGLQFIARKGTLKQPDDLKVLAPGRGQGHHAGDHAAAEVSGRARDRV